MFTKFILYLFFIAKSWRNKKYKKKFLLSIFFRFIFEKKFVNWRNPELFLNRAEKKTNLWCIKIISIYLRIKTGANEFIIADQRKTFFFFFEILELLLLWLSRSRAKIQFFEFFKKFWIPKTNLIILVWVLLMDFPLNE